MTVLVISDDLDTRHELIGQARLLADSLGSDVSVLAVGPCECDPPGKGAFSRGADKVLLTNPPIEEFDSERYASAALSDGTIPAKHDAKQNGDDVNVAGRQLN